MATSPQLEKSPCKNEDPAPPRVNNFFFFLRGDSGAGIQHSREVQNNANVSAIRDWAGGGLNVQTLHR